MTTSEQTYYLRNNPDAQRILDYIAGHPYIDGHEIRLAFPEIPGNIIGGILNRLYIIGLIRKGNCGTNRTRVWWVA